MPEVTESPRGAMGKQMKAGGGPGERMFSTVLYKLQYTVWMLKDGAGLLSGRLGSVPCSLDGVWSWDGPLPEP